MGALIIWLDSEKAKIFRLLPEGLTRKVLRDEGPQHPVESPGRNHPLHQTDEERFYRRLVESLEHEPSQEWLLMGPGPGKGHFLNHLERKAPEMLKKIVGEEKIGGLSDAQILERGRSFFQRHHLFTS